MTILLFALIVVVLLMLALWAVESIPMQAPVNWIVRVLLIVIAIVVISNRAGLL